MYKKTTKLLYHTFEAVINLQQRNSPIDSFIKKINPIYHHSIFGNYTTNIVYSMINLMHMLQYTSDKTDLIWNVNNNISSKCMAIDKIVKLLKPKLIDMDEETDSEPECHDNKNSDDKAKEKRKDRKKTKSKRKNNNNQKNELNDKVSKLPNKNVQRTNKKQLKEMNQACENSNSSKKESMEKTQNRDSKHNNNDHPIQVDSKVLQLIEQYGKLQTHFQSTVKFTNQIKEMNDVFKDVIVTVLYGNIVDSANYFQQLKERGAMFAYALFEIIKYKENGMNEERTTTVRAIEKYEKLKQQMDNLIQSNQHQVDTLNKQLHNLQSDHKDLQNKIAIQESEITRLSLIELRAKAKQQQKKTNSGSNNKSNNNKQQNSDSF